MRRLTPYTLHTGKLSRPLRFAVVSDLHDESYQDILPMLQGADALLVPGDITNRYRGTWDRGLEFLRDASRLLPTFFSLGNHETRQRSFRALVEQLEQTGAEVLVNRYVPFGECFIGGWYDPQVVREPDMLDAFEALPGCKVLLCHKPNHYLQYMRQRKLDLVVSGHAHGGQIRLLGRGLYAPDQLFFPKYTRGIVDGRMIISAGAGNPVRIPRWNNPPEVLMVTLD